MSYVDRLPHWEMQTTPLANGIEWKTLMFAKDVSLFIYKNSSADTLLQIFHFVFQETVIVVIRDETDFIRIRLGSHIQQAVLFRQLTDFGFSVFTEREDGSFQVFLDRKSTRLNSSHVA